MSITPTPITAALAGAFSALVWPSVWARYGGADTPGSVELVVATLLVIALPAHAFVVGMRRSPSSPTRTLDTALLKRIGAWLGAAAFTALVTAAVRS